MVDQIPVDDRLAIRIRKHGRAENVRRMQGGRRGQTDADGIEVIEHLPILAYIIAMVFKLQLDFVHFFIQRIAAVGFVDDDAVILVNRRNVFGTVVVKNALQHSLNGGDMHFRLRIGLLVVQRLQTVNLGKRLKVLHSAFFKRRFRLFGERFSINEKQNAPKPFRFEQAVNQADRHARFSRSRRHGDKHAPALVFKRPLNSLNRPHLVRPQFQIIKRFITQPLFGSFNVLFQQLFQPVRRIPALQRARMVRRFPGVQKPNAGLLFKLFHVRTAVGGEQKWNEILPPRLVNHFLPMAHNETGVLFCLFDIGGDVFACAFRFNEADQLQADKKSIIGNPVPKRPFGNRQIPPLLWPRAFGKAQFFRISLPASRPQLFIDDEARLCLSQFEIRHRPPRIVTPLLFFLGTRIQPRLADVRKLRFQVGKPLFIRFDEPIQFIRRFR